LFFFIASVTTRVNANGGEFASFAPAFDGKRRDAKNLGDFADGEKIRQIVEV
jgi:hypothetical protein